MQDKSYPQLIMDTASVNKHRYCRKLGGWVPKGIRMKRILRCTLQKFVDEPAWSYAGRKDEPEILSSMLRRCGVRVTTIKDHKKLIIEIEIDGTSKEYTGHTNS